ncbi:MULTISPECIES: hypothetical protein [Nocardiopsis]|uniref:Uncharacterized protein n=1 Tax=Nocardiopsis sinuspersici TaxID=501010 RepID=A0A1V3C772_9ACTN|nr:MULTISPECIES: hypothetical protein [Nocardiopsis]OOC56482.1 hypothetical protein NOSIN_23835 [Nocardiopsis sinuspersici]
MTIEPDSERRLKFYGLNDYGTYHQVERVKEVLEVFDPLAVGYSTSDIIELHNAQLFIENQLYPQSFDSEQRAAWQALRPQLRTVVAKFFNALNDDNFADVITDVHNEYKSDLLQLLAKFKVYDRCSATTVLPALKAVRISMGGLLGNKRLVQKYNHEVRALILADSANAEYLARKHLENNAQQSVHLPSSLTIDDQRALINSYVDSDDPNPNYVKLISFAPLHTGDAVDAKLKLKARRKHQKWTEEFFKKNTGIATGCTVAVDDEQTDPAKLEMDGMVANFSYSRLWLEDTLDQPSILNNFLYVFEFANYHMLLTLPSYRAQLGVLEQLMEVKVKGAYPLDSAFRSKEGSSSLQLAFYRDYLKSKDVEIESVIAWFFSSYLKDEFEVLNFRFTPSSTASTYLEKCRHTFAEMESILQQFTLYAKEGELDLELLNMNSEQVSYKTIPSLLKGKYAYPTSSQDVHAILYLLFSDQSELTYISEELHGNNAVDLLINHEVSYDDFADYQKDSVDYLIDQEVLKNNGQRIVFANCRQLLVLRDVVDDEVASYYHYSTKSRAAIDELVEREWLVRRESLLSEAEASYFNYYLNKAEFTNGPDLRNKYMHGSNVDAANEQEHFSTYISALKLLIALVIKINDEFWLRSVQMDN